MNALLLLVLAADPAADAVIQALSVRHDPPPCAALEVGLADPAATWRRLADDTRLLPWVPVRAARCLMAHPEPAEQALRAWLADPTAMGVVTAALPAAHGLPHVAEVIAEGLKGPHAGLLRQRLADDPLLADAARAGGAP